MNKSPRYLLTNQFDIGMLASLTANISLTEISLDEVCHLIEEAEHEKQLGLHGGWADAVNSRAAKNITPGGPILLVAHPAGTDHGMEMKWVRVEIFSIEWNPK